MVEASKHQRLTLSNGPVLIFLAEVSKALRVSAWGRAENWFVLVTAELLGQPRPDEETPTESAVRFESASYEKLPCQGQHPEKHYFCPE